MQRNDFIMQRNDLQRNDFAAKRLYYAAKRLVAKRLCSETTVNQEKNLVGFASYLTHIFI